MKSLVTGVLCFALATAALDAQTPVPAGPVPQTPALEFKQASGG